MSTILVIDDEENIRQVMEQVLTDEKYNCFTAKNGEDGLNILSIEPVDVVILDVWLPKIGGLELLEIIKKDYPEIEVIMISGHATINIAVKATKMGAVDFLEKPISLDKLLTMVGNAVQIKKLKTENKKLKSTLKRDCIIGESDKIKEIKTLIETAAHSDSRIFILGENGTGKELVAREIHNKSNRKTYPFIEINCAAIPENLIEDELFGHVAGAFTGAMNTRKGKFELAHEGTIFLDEIADMSLSTQAKVLRVLQELKFERIGSTESIEVDVRVISATNKNIKDEIQKGNFREDLFYRLNVIPFYIPALRERKSDIPILVNYFLKGLKPDSVKKIKTISNEAIEMFMNYDWPGNVRELKNVIERLNIMVNDLEIKREHIKKYLGDMQRQEKPVLLNNFENMNLNEAKDQFEKAFLMSILEKNNANITQTAKELGIYPSNLHSKLTKLGINVKELKNNGV